MANTLSSAMEIVVRTDPGQVRTHNEDAVFANPQRGLVILADGMGGYNAGEVASSMATTILAQELEQAFAVKAPHTTQRTSSYAYARACLEAKITAANLAIYQAAQGQPQYAGMGTTLVTALFYDNRVTVAHIGDSRLYRLRDARLEVLTRDHSLLQEQLDSGMITPEEARHSTNRNLVTRALGVDPLVQAEIRDYPVVPGDVYLLCSDGLNDMVDDDEIRQVLQVNAGDLENAAGRLIQQANDNGGRDNVSVILVGIVRAFPAAREAWSQFTKWFKVR